MAKRRKITVIGKNYTVTVIFRRDFCLASPTPEELQLLVSQPVDLLSKLGEHLGVDVTAAKKTPAAQSPTLPRSELDSE